VPKVFRHDNCEQISFIIFFAFLKKEEMRSGTHFTQQIVFLLFTVVVTKHVWPYFQSHFPKTSSERVSSLEVYGSVFRRIMENHPKLSRDSLLCIPTDEKIGKQGLNEALKFFCLSFKKRVSNPVGPLILDHIMWK